MPLGPRPCGPARSLHSAAPGGGFPLPCRGAAPGKGKPPPGRSGKNPSGRGRATAPRRAGPSCAETETAAAASTGRGSGQRSDPSRGPPTGADPSGARVRWAGAGRARASGIGERGWRHADRGRQRLEGPCPSGGTAASTEPLSMALSMREALSRPGIRGACASAGRRRPGARPRQGWQSRRVARGASRSKRRVAPSSNKKPSRQFQSSLTIM